MSLANVLSNSQPFHVEVGDVLDGLAKLPDGCLQSVVTSPPYWGLRSYLPKGHPDKPREIGSEQTPEAFVQRMVEVFCAVRRVLRDDGTLWVNLGDTYDSGTRSERRPSPEQKQHGYWNNENIRQRVSSQTTKAGDLMNMPHAVALALQADGWILRSTIIWCLSGGTWVYARTAKGDAPAMLKDLARLDPSTVQLWTGSRWTRVISWTRNRPPKKLKTNDKRDGFLEIEFRSGERVGCTAEHHWPTNRGLLQAKDLAVGDIVPTCRLPEPDSPRSLLLDDHELGWLVGFYLAEGCKTDKGVAFAVHADERAEYERIESIANRLDGSATFQKRSGRGAAIVVYSRTMREMIGEYISGTSCKNKRLTRKAWMRSDQFLHGLLHGYLDGDGHRDPKNDRWRIGFTNNDGLATDIRTLAARLGIICRLRRAVHKCQTGSFAGWRGELRETQSPHWSTKQNGEIVAIRKSRAREYWDVEVADEPHLFALASGILTHNCKRSPMPESISGWRWRRCRVKVARGQYANETNPGSYKAATSDENGKANRHCSGGVWAGDAQWSPCPGCSKCRDTGGYVLRRGSWRPTTAHEYIFLFTKTGEYFCDGDAVAEPATYAGQTGKVSTKRAAAMGRKASGNEASSGRQMVGETRNPRSVWTLSSEPEKAKHFATFPSAIPRKCLTAATSKAGCCPQCGACYAPVVDSERVATRPGCDSKVWSVAPPESPMSDHAGTVGNRDPQRHVAVTKVSGYRPTCQCNAGDPVPCLVADIFSGSGTTGRVAYDMGLRYIGLELSEEYAAISREKIVRPFAVPKSKRQKPARTQTRTLFS